MDKHAIGLIAGFYTYMIICAIPIILGVILNSIIIVFCVVLIVPVAWIGADFVYDKINPDEN